MNPLELALAVMAGAFLAFFFVSAPICLIMITRRLGAMGMANADLTAKLGALEKYLKEGANPQLKAIENLKEAVTHAVSQAGQSAQQELTKTSDALSSYGPLLIRINDFYAAVQHFEARIKDGAMMANDLSKAISGLHEIIREGGRAAADVNGVMAKMRLDQKALADSHKEMLKTLQQQQEAFEKILGEVKVRVAVDVDYSVTRTLEKLSTELARNTNIISALEGTLELIRKELTKSKTFWERIFG